MLSEEEKREMLEDARSEERRESFRAAKSMIKEKPMSLDEYISFLDDVQKIFRRLRCRHGIRLRVRTNFNIKLDARLRGHDEMMANLCG